MVWKLFFPLFFFLTIGGSLDHVLLLVGIMRGSQRDDLDTFSENGLSQRDDLCDSLL